MGTSFTAQDSIQHWHKKQRVASLMEAMTQPCFQSEMEA